ncbi:MAG: hypothetical protein GX600_05800 [Dehalococcoidia bacterium]|nr:hypothetical protein [Dehalococcoidia bacterium]
MAVTFSFFPRPVGRRVALLGLGGGATVLASDEATKEGLAIPGFPEDLRKRATTIVGNEAGTIIDNPMDISAEAWEVGYYPLLKLFAEYKGIDLTIVHLSVGLIAQPPKLHTEIWNKLVDDIVRAHIDFGKPIVVVTQMMTLPEHYDWMVQARETCYRAGIATYNSIRHAARSGHRLLRYYEKRAARGEPA